MGGISNAGKFKSVVGPSTPITLVIAANATTSVNFMYACHYVGITINTVT